MRENFLIGAVLIAGALLFFTCSNRNSLYDIQDAGGIRLFAFISDSVPASPALSDSTRLSVTDTFHTSDTVRFLGLVSGDTSRLARRVWLFGDGDSSCTLQASHAYRSGRVYTAICLVADRMGNEMRDTVVVFVNTPPKVDSLLVPQDGQSKIDPTTQKGVYFKWKISDQDSGDRVAVDLYMDTCATFSHASILTNQDTCCYATYPSLPFTRYFWRIVARDKYGDADTSRTFSFYTKNPNSTMGKLLGHAIFQGWKCHAGIRISIRDYSGDQYPLFVSTDPSGKFSADLRDGAYHLFAEDTLKHSFAPDSGVVTITMSEIAVVDTLVLKDTAKPLIKGYFPVQPQTTRLPEIFCSYSDTASGIMASSVTISVNDSNVTPAAAVTLSGVTWRPAARLTDGDYRVCIRACDSAGNCNSVAWRFAVDAMRIVHTNDTTVSINDTVWFPCSVYDAYAPVKQYKWDFDGNGTWDDSVSDIGTRTIRAFRYAKPGFFGAVLYVRDAAGDMALDTEWVTVLVDPPFVDAGKDTTIFTGDTFSCAAHAHDAFGKIVRYYWSYDGVNFRDSTADSVFTLVRSSPDTLKIFVKVRDDDGNLSSPDSATIISVNFVKKWEFSIGGQTMYNTGASSPAVSSDGTVYVEGLDTIFYALDVDGKIKWSIPSGAKIETSPAIGPDGEILMEMRSYPSSLFALSVGGTEKWQFTIAGPHCTNPAIALDGTVYFGGTMDSMIFALSAQGVKKWSFTAGNTVLSSPAVAIDGTEYAGGNDGTLYAITSGGIKKWGFATSSVLTSGPALAGDGTIYFGSGDGKLYAVNPDGRKKWEFATGGAVNSSPALAGDGTIYVGSNDTKLYAVNPDGTKKWEFITGGGVVSSPAVGANGTIYVGSNDFVLYAINPDGTKKWEINTSGEIRSSPVICADGTVYVSSMDKKLYAIRTASRGLANSAWPMFRHNAQHTGSAQ